MSTPSTGEDPRSAILWIVLCGAEPRGDKVVVDAKFHDSMRAMIARLEVPMTALLPRFAPGESHELLDSHELAVASLPYRIAYVSYPLISAANFAIIEHLLDETRMVVLGALESFNMAIADLCRRRGVPYIIITEYTLDTTLRIMRATTPSLLRRMVREVRMRLGKRRRHRMVAGAAEIHCKGYPTYDEFAATNPHRLLFIDTHAMPDDIISNAELRARLASRHSRPARLIYSGRYHPMKGTLDIIRVALELDRRGFDFRLEMYGKGPLRETMEAMARRGTDANKIAIHDPVPYRPDLQRVLRESDLFVCCHIQGDPSCTYLETLAGGVPIVGYSNEMWTPLCRESGAGAALAMGDYKALADTVIQMLTSDALDEKSHRAREFAATHTMETVLERRSARMAALLGIEVTNSFASASR